MGDWETALSSDYVKCSTKSAGISSYTYTDPVFDSDDAIDYFIGSGLQNVAFTDWIVSPNTCTQDLEYETYVTAAGVQTSDLSVVDPT